MILKSIIQNIKTKAGIYFTGLVGLIIINIYFESLKDCTIKILVTKAVLVIEQVRSEIYKFMSNYNLLEKFETLIKENNIIKRLLEAINQNIEIIQSKITSILNSPKGSNNLFITDIINEVQKFLTVYPNEILPSLNIHQKGAVFHICFVIVIFLCLSSIIAIFYGEILITKLNLEERFPKLARYIQLRRKFQQYYFLINTLIIIFALLIILYVDLIVLFS